MRVLQFVCVMPLCWYCCCAGAAAVPVPCVVVSSSARGVGVSVGWL